jgi:hypothetical protein
MADIMTDPNEAEDREAAERAKLNEAMVMMSAENSVINIRVAELAEMHRSARARWSAAKGQLTRAMKDGSAEKIAAAHERERAAYADFDHIGRAAIRESATLNGASLDNDGRVLDQMGPTWEAAAEVTRRLTHPEPEAEL